MAAADPKDKQYEEKDIDTKVEEIAKKGAVADDHWNCTLYEEDNFKGKSLRVTGDFTLEEGDDKAYKSIKVNRGVCICHEKESFKGNYVLIKSGNDVSEFEKIKCVRSMRYISALDFDPVGTIVLFSVWNAGAGYHAIFRQSVANLNEELWVNSTSTPIFSPKTGSTYPTTNISCFYILSGTWQFEGDGDTSDELTPNGYVNVSVGSVGVPNNSISKLTKL